MNTQPMIKEIKNYCKKNEIVAPTVSKKNRSVYIKERVSYNHEQRLHDIARTCGYKLIIY